MNTNIERRLSVLEAKAEPVTYQIVWHDDEVEPGVPVIQLKWGDVV